MRKLWGDDEVQSKNKLVLPDHDPTIPWNQMVTLKGMKFENPKQLKHLIANYVVVNGYALWYENDDSSCLLVKCGKEDALLYYGSLRWVKNIPSK